eukprot:gnl/Dysnectes_brevis/6120_a9237_443.p1 GENE.gnl/Dysnectes_brevis/6120_a9237_443~~gnl/Dysnectes_brevis/6120_a9237_443.p1  ORF type:complete len:542 (+),score=61.03 gnl/Dysnectes_brevis/6120_a9237_443:54-1679(+)
MSESDDSSYEGSYISNPSFTSSPYQQPIYLTEESYPKHLIHRSSLSQPSSSESTPFPSPSILQRPNPLHFQVPGSLHPELSATVMTRSDLVDETCYSQIQQIVDHPAFRSSSVVIMPDLHVGKGCVIGLTATMEPFQSSISDLGSPIQGLPPSVVGVDIGCGVAAWKIPVTIGDGTETESVHSLPSIDKLIHSVVPSGHNIHSKPPSSTLQQAVYQHILRSPGDSVELFWSQVREACHRHTSCQLTRAQRSLGTLGGGNHFIELDVVGGSKWLVIHSGSRHFGYSVANSHIQIASSTSQPRDHSSVTTASDDGWSIPRSYRYPHDLHALWSDDRGLEAYIRDTKLCQQYAKFNRHSMGYSILQGLGIPYHKPDVESVHNYVDFIDNTIRKGAISARLGQPVIIPLNMQAGTLLGVGKGNPAWNCSAPHGAGRVLSRTAAFKQLSLPEFKRQMSDAGVWSTCVGSSTLDEAPGAYKSPGLIKRLLEETVELTAHLHPVYSFKATGGHGKRSGRGRRGKSARLDWEERMVEKDLSPFRKRVGG